jgi:radical SAM protein with 4Fe4S-binding SPASM domain
MRLRHEPWGAWALVPELGIAGLSHEGVRALGLAPPPAHALAAPRPPIEVHVAVTARCAAGCVGCYTGATADGVEPPRADLERTLDTLADAGVFVVAFGGGEPTTRADLAALAQSARARGLWPVVTTSGLGLDDAKLDALAAFERVNVSYDGESVVYDAVRGFDGARHAESAISRLASRGARVGVNVVLTRRSFAHLAETIDRAHDLGAREAQLLRYKPAGRASSLSYLSTRLSRAQVAEFPRIVRALSGRHADLHVRIDCALVPFLVHASDVSPEDLLRYGVLGCEAAEYLMAARVDGRVSPCSFANATDDTDLEAWRGNKTNGSPCCDCSFRSVCKGGCRVVSAHLRGNPFAPDPECPRVVSYEASRR